MKLSEKTKKRLLFLSLLALGAALRLTLIGRFPPGLNQDEASEGYEALCLLREGMDRNGNPWPVLFVSWGSGQNVLYAYLSLPFLAFFGLSPFSLRLTAGVFGTLSLPLFFDVARRCRGERFAWWAMLVLAVNPWHILLSRWALESNLLPFFLLLGMDLLLRTEEEPRWLYGAAAVFALSLYAYGTAFFFLLLFLPAASLLLRQQGNISLKRYFGSMALFILIAFPIAFCQLRNALGLESCRLFGLTLPALHENRQSATTLLGGGSFFDNVTCFLRILREQSDGLIWNSAGKFGLFYGRPGFALVLAGLVSSFVSLFRGTLSNAERYLLLALLLCFPIAGLLSPNVNRMNMAFLFLVYYQAAGLFLLGKKLRPLLLPLIAAAVFAFGRYYFTDYAAALAPAFYDGLCEAVALADRSTGDEVWISWDVNMPYIYVLFTEEIEGGEYRSTVSFANPHSAFEWVSSFSRWRFGRVPPEDGSVCIVREDRADGMTVLGQYGEWVVGRYGGAETSSGG